MRFKSSIFIGKSNPLKYWRYNIGAETILYEYLGTSNNIKVPLNTIINNYTDGTNIPFYNQSSIKSVNLRNAQFVNNNMDNAFANSQNLISVNNIGNKVVSMNYTFSNCYNLACEMNIPNSVLTMESTFTSCVNLDYNIQIPNSVQRMVSTFWNCTRLNQNIRLSSNALSLDSVFYNCSGLNQNINIPNSATSLNYAFAKCSILNQNIRIPSTVRWMYRTFDGCSNLVQHIDLPKSCVNADYCFADCTNIRITGLSNTNLTSYQYTFKNCKSIKSISDVFYMQLNTLQQIQSINGLFYNCIELRPTTAITLDTVYTWSLKQFLTNCTNLRYMHETFYGINTFTDSFAGVCNEMQSIETASFAFANTSISDASNCFSDRLTLITVNGCFANCNSLFNMYRTFANCTRLKFANGAIPYNTSQTSFCFANCSNLQGNIYIYSPKLSNIDDMFYGYNTQLRKNIYIYFNYANGEPSLTYNKFSTNSIYTGSSELGNPMYNNISNFYVYNLGVAPF